MINILQDKGIFNYEDDYLKKKKTMKLQEPDENDSSEELEKLSIEREDSMSKIVKQLIFLNIII